MDPLTKIAAATQETAQKIDAVVAAVSGGAGASLNQELITELKTQTDLLKTIAGNTKDGGGIKVDGKQVKEDKLIAGANAIKLLGGGASSLAIGLLMFMLVPKSAIKKFTETIKDLMAAFDELDLEKVETGSRAFEIITSSISRFVKGLALAGILFIPAIMGAGLIMLSTELLLPTFEKLGDSEGGVEDGANVLDLMGGALKSFAKGLVLAAIGSTIGILFTPLIVLAMVIIGGAFALLGNLSRTIRRGARATRLMGRALVNFSAGLVFFALTSMIILAQPKILLAMVGTLVLIGGAFALLGLVSRPIRRGARALFVMGISLVLFSIGYLFFAMAVKDTTIKDIFMQAGILVGTGLAFAILGKRVVQIIQGAIAVAAMGLGLLVFGLGYLPFAAVTKDMTLESIGIQLALLLGLGLEFAAAGVGSLFILAGAGAFAAVGVALLLLAPGLLAIKKVDFTQEDSIKLATLLSGVKSAFLGGKDADEGFFAKVGGAITGAVDSVRMIEAAAGFIAAGIALKTLSWGLIAFKKVGFTQEDTLELTTMLNGITTAFALAGSSEQVPSSSFFGQMFGFKRTAVEEGIQSVMSAGKALSKIAKGLKDFQALINSGVNFGTPDSDGNYEKGTMGYAVTNTIGFISQAFGAVAEQGNVEAGGFFNTLFGIKKNKVAEGIDSVMGAGKALTSITKGLISFQDLIDKKVDFNKLGEAVSHTVGFISQAFGAVAEQGNVEAGGFFNSLFGIKKNKVAEGIDSVKGAGKELTNIATGLETFQKLVDKNIDWDKLSDAVTKSLGFVGTAFANIGGMTDEDSTGLSRFFGITWDENRVAKGVEAVQGAGKELTNIAQGLEKFQKLIDSKVDFDKLGTAIKDSLTIVGDAFAIVGGNEQTDSAFFGLIKWDENLVQKGIVNVKGAGTELTNIAKGLQSFADLKDPRAIAKSIKSIFTSIGDTFTFYYEKPKFKGQLDHMKIFVNTMSQNAKKGYIHKAADGMKKMAAAVNSIDSTKAEAFANLFKGAGELTDNKLAFQSLLKAVEDIREALAGSGAVEQPAVTTTPGATPPANQSGLQPTLSSINATLSRLNGTMSSLPSAIQSIKLKAPGE